MTDPYSITVSTITVLIRYSYSYSDSIVSIVSMERYESEGVYCRPEYKLVLVISENGRQKNRLEPSYLARNTVILTYHFTAS